MENNAVWYRKRIEALAAWLDSRQIAAAVFQDSEEKRDPAIRYFTGHAGDAVLVLTSRGQSALVAWDEHLAHRMASADTIIPFNRFDRDAVCAVKGVLAELNIAEGSKIELPPSTPYPDFLKFADALRGFDALCRNADGTHEQVAAMRAVKDAHELESIRTACNITNVLIDRLEDAMRTGKIATEMDAALFIERESRLLGAEGSSFETLAAGPARSFGIHAFPAYTAAPFPADGMSILDFGVLVDGYASDVTLTIVRGNLSPAQETQVALVEQAYNAALALYRDGKPTSLAAQKADALFSASGRTMPHALGHGVGLEVHEFPRVRATAGNDVCFRAGMVVTLEPGLYDPALGGCRLENDILITESGNETLTTSRIIRLADGA